MPSKTKLKNAAIAAVSAVLPKIPNELIDQFLTGPMIGEAVNAASMAFKKALIERAMGAELGHQLGYAPGGTKPEASSPSFRSTTTRFSPPEPGFRWRKFARNPNCGDASSNRPWALTWPTPRPAASASFYWRERAQEVDFVVLVGDDGIASEEFLLRPVSDWAGG